MSDLQQLELEASREPTPQTIERVQQLELEIDLLRKQCKSPRHYVASSVEGATPDPSSPTRRRRILLKVTNSVTTIIKGKDILELSCKLIGTFLVVEDALKRQAKSKKKSRKGQGTSAETQQDDLENLHRRLSELQSTTAEDLTPTIEQADGGESSVKMEEVNEGGDPKIEALLESASQVRTTIDSMVSDQEMPADGYEHLLQTSMVSFWKQIHFCPTRNDIETSHLTGTLINLKKVTLFVGTNKKRQIYDRFLSTEFRASRGLLITLFKALLTFWERSSFFNHVPSKFNIFFCRKSGATSKRSYNK
jgi:hypothetical protein